MSMMDDPEMYVHEIRGSDNKRIGAITVFPSYGWVALGTYFNKTGGMDTLKNNWCTRQTLLAALDGFPEYNVMMEGIMASTIFSTYVSLFNDVQDYYQMMGEDLQVLILSLVPPVEVAISRVYSRNGGKPIKEESLCSKWETVSRNVDKFAMAGFISIRVNSAKVPKEKMLSAFVKTVHKYTQEVKL